MSDSHNCTTHLMSHPDGKNHLPQPRGPHSVGYFDLMTPGDGQKGSLLRVYYPTLEQCLESSDRWPKWIDEKYSAGLLTFIKGVLHRWPSWAKRDEYAHFNLTKLVSPLMPSVGFPALFKWIVGTVHIPIIRNAEPIPNKKWPILVFSHGLGCARFTYSQVCYDLASHGFIVAAPEHRDGSGCLSFFNESGTKQWVPHRRVEHSENEYDVRNDQLNQRCSEVRRALDVMTAINKGDYVENILEPDDIVTEMDLSKLKDKFDLSSPIVCGHSFGGATTLYSLAKDSRFKLGVVLDGWLFPLRDEDVALQVDQPIMFINTESFLHEENLEKLRSFEKAPSERVSFSIKGSVHQNHIDTPFVVQKSLLRKVLGVHSKTCPETVMMVTNRLIVRFIRKHLNLDDDDEVNSELDQQKHLINEGFGARPPEACQDSE